MGKVGSPMKVIVTGTLAPADPGSWWPAMIEAGTVGSVNVQAIQGRRDKWDSWREIVRVNPLAKDHAEFAAVLREERDAARRDSRLKASFLSMRLNLPSGDESSVLLTVDDWQRTMGRTVPERSGRPIVGVDLGAGRAWSAAVAMWRSGRVECLALAPGIPTLEAQEKRDRAPVGTYRKLAAGGSLHVATGLRVQPAAQLWRAVTTAWGPPAAAVCDRFRLSELADCVNGTPVVARVARWSEASEDIRALRRMAADGPLSVAESSRDLMAASLSTALVVNDDSGSTRLRKRGSNNQARDDVAAALTLVAGMMERAPAPRRVRRHALAG